MEFRLTYDGPLRSNRGAREKHELRRHFHVQLRELLSRRAMDGYRSLIEAGKLGSTFINLRGFAFAPLITEKTSHVASIHVTLLTPEEPGRAITRSGDLDNRLKTLLDALRAPKVPDEVPKGVAPGDNETPFFCLLEDDALIDGLSVTSDRLLRPGARSSDVLLIIHVVPRRTTTTLGTLVWTL